MNLIKGLSLVAVVLSFVDFWGTEIVYATNSDDEDGYRPWRTSKTSPYRPTRPWQGSPKNAIPYSPSRLGYGERRPSFDEIGSEDSLPLSSMLTIKKTQDSKEN